MRKALGAAVAAIVALVLSGCAAMPTTGAVQAGLAPEEAAEWVDLAFRPALPQQGATPEQIVDGFIAAGTSPAGNWEIAQEFLTEAARETWKPDAGVTIDDFADRQLTQTSDRSFVLSVSPVADVDETGSYDETDAGTSSLEFELEQRADGEWRISSLGDGIVIDRDLFPRVFRAYSLVYFDPSWQYLVPDVRWFAMRNNTLSRIVRELITGAPSPWLADSVVTAFPDDLRAPGAVTVTDGVARIDLDSGVLDLPADQLSRMKAQVAATLASASVSDARMMVGTVEVDVSAAAVRSTRVDARPAVLTAEGFGFLSGDEVQPIPGITEALRDAGVQPTAIALSPDRDVAALQVPTGAVGRMSAEQGYQQLDARDGLVAPVIDSFGYVWTVPADNPAAVTAFAADGSAVSVADAWSGASRIRSMQVSRDGTRMVALVDIGGRSEAWVAGVVRDGSAPVRLAQWRRLAALPSAGIAVTWLDDTTVGVVAGGGASSSVLTQPVGGLTTTASGPTGVRVTAIAGSTTSIRMRDDEGTMFTKAGTRWRATADGIIVLATQQGSPR
ncbi:MAG: LpqB family beta-propeller domain-containing protein [Microbacterium sp.]|uniref:LpqB family beta-propeller domain-containing protein n=1 Tax=Microbacterium sp. TaxID=51671 RepID=UPI0039E2AA83